jgi:hypothetical protein
MSDIFASAKSVLRRANHHVMDLTSTIEDTFTTDKPYAYTVDFDQDSGAYSHRFTFSETFADDVGCLMFDAVNNLRSTLDQMTYAVVDKTVGDPDRRHTYFPFSDCEANFLSVKGRLKDNIPAEILTLYEQLKPYKGGNNILWAVNRMANVKKHALLIRPGFGRTAFWHSGPNGTELIGATNSKENEIVFKTINNNFQPQAQFTYQIVIQHSEEVIDGQSPIILFNAMANEVERVLSDTEVECRRIGLIG